MVFSANRKRICEECSIKSRWERLRLEHSAGDFRMFQVFDSACAPVAHAPGSPARLHASSAHNPQGGQSLLQLAHARLRYLRVAEFQ